MYRTTLIIKKLQEFRMIIPGIICRCAAVLVCYARISAVGEKQLNDLRPGLTSRKREMQRRHSLRLLHVGIGPVLQQELDQPHIVCLHGTVERRLTVIGGGVDAGTIFEQQSGNSIPINFGSLTGRTFQD